jgi:tight adherence protein C
MFLLLAAVCFSGSAVAIANIATMPARARRDRIRAAATYGNVRVTAAAPKPLKFRERAVGPLVTWLARGMLRLNPRQSVESVSALLISAGMRDASPHAFLAAKAAGGVGGLLIGLLFGMSSGTMALGFAVILGAVGYMLPAVIVSSRAKRRQARLTSELPDALDLLAVSVEAGLGFDAAIAKLTQYMEGPLSEEFELALGEMRIGESRPDALKKLADRVGTVEVSGFVRAIVQADQLGTSLGRILRVQATDTRLKRQAAAEEKAMKAPIKMLFPTVGFIFPAMFIVVLGPALLSLGKLFGF